MNKEKYEEIADALHDIANSVGELVDYIEFAECLSTILNRPEDYPALTADPVSFLKNLMKEIIRA